MSQYQITGICQKTVSITDCAQEGLSLISKQSSFKGKLFWK